MFIVIFQTHQRKRIFFPLPYEKNGLTTFIYIYIYTLNQSSKQNKKSQKQTQELKANVQ